MGDDILVKIMGLTDVLAAIIIACLDVPIIGKLKWILIVILLLKGVPSLLA